MPVDRDIPAVAIINYNTRDHLKACLRTVLADNPAEVVVVDNHSKDRSVEMVRRLFPSVTVVANSTNIGYGAAANQAIARCSSPYVAVLNSDTLLCPGALRTFGEYMQRHPEAGMMGPKLLNSDGTLQPSCYPLPGTLRWVFDNDVSAPLIRLVPGLRELCFRTWSHDRPRKVPWVKGAVMVIRREALSSIGGFDPSIFLYHEETDVCLRMRDKGWETHFVPVPPVIHIGEASTGQQRAEMTVQLYRSTVTYYERHYSKLRVWLLVALWRIFTGTRSLIGALRPWGALEKNPLEYRSLLDR